MLFLIHHHTSYRFERPVFLEPHEIRLMPRQDGTQKVLDFRMEMDPEPAGLWFGLDAESSPFASAWFNDLHAELSIRTTCRVSTLRNNPYGFLLSEAAQALPPRLSPAEAAALAPCLKRSPAPPGGADLIADLARDIRDQAAGVQGNGTCLGFAVSLNTWLFAHLTKVVRSEPGIQPPAETLHTCTGSCRDSAVLFMDCCRAAGIPARFVSGYQEGDPDEPYRELHAWAEVFIPGAGWIGCDPTHGLLTAESHVALSASHDPAQAAPVRGAYRGTGVASQLDHAVRIELVKS